MWPPLIDGGTVLTPAQFALLIEAMDWRRTVSRPAPQVPVQMSFKGLNSPFPLGRERPFC